MPILTFVLGWILNQKQSQYRPHPTGEVVQQTEKKNGTFLGQKISLPLRRKTDPRNVDLSLFWEVWNELEANFLYQEDLDTQEQLYGAARGLVRSTEDPYTTFMAPEETKEFEESISGEFEGIGAEIAIRDEQLIVISPLKGSPAELAGLRAGDHIFKIDGEPTFDMSVMDAVMQIRGPKGEKVSLEVIREGEPNPIQITIVRDTIQVKSLEWRMQEGIAVIEISQFGTELMNEFLAVLPQISLAKPDGIVLDLRNNGGGLLDAALRFGNEFFDRKVLVTTRGRQFGDSGALQSGPGGAFIEIPLVVMVNRGSASASEIFAGAVQDHRRGVVIGETSFGKGSVQNVIPLSDGSSLKVTVAEWLTPLGRSIHEVGIEPDEAVERTQEDFENDLDPVMDRAFDILANPEALQELLAPEPEEADGTTTEDGETSEAETNEEAPAEESEEAPAPLPAE
ncbi:MAG: S41 family peptidase [Candidatus Gracilibacteria bacterium]|nr:S41 family peptidase [Candidatus Gracilibacteria bacterium]